MNACPFGVGIFDFISHHSSRTRPCWCHLICLRPGAGPRVVFAYDDLCPLNILVSHGLDPKVMTILSILAKQARILGPERTRPDCIMGRLVGNVEK